jgi:hypothetical protein
MVKQNVEEINSGNVRSLVYIGLMSVSSITNFVCPVLVLSSNSKMRLAILKGLKDNPTIGRFLK